MTTHLVRGQYRAVICPQFTTLEPEVFGTVLMMTNQSDCISDALNRDGPIGIGDIVF
jgi:hypothetical protein